MPAHPATRRRHISLCLLALVLICAAVLFVSSRRDVTLAAPRAAAPSTFTNPLVSPDGADPFMLFHDGSYYLTYTTGNDVRIRKAARLADMPVAKPQEVWRDKTPGRSRAMWAPEFFLLDDTTGKKRWYLYYTAGDGKNDESHRCFVLEADRPNGTPLGPYHFKSQLHTDAQDANYAIDADLLVTPAGKLFFLFCSHPGHVLSIAPMDNPWTVHGEKAVNIPADGFGCPEVREGPCCFTHGDNYFLLYSICDTGKPDYKLGLLNCATNADPTDVKKWKQYPKPVLTRHDEVECYGPGHNGVFKSPDGTEDWLVFHAKDTKEYTYARRTPRAQKITWTPDGFPDLGTPVKLGETVAAPSGEPAR